MLWNILTSRSRRKQILSHPERLQADLLRRLLSRARHTEMGRQYNFADLARQPDVIAAYRRQVPLHCYADYEPQIDRMKTGEADILCPGTVTWYAISGGTTAGKKLIPQTAELTAGIQRYQVDMACGYMDVRGRKPVFLKPGMGLSGNLVPDPAFPKIVIGEVSGLMVEQAWRRVPRFLRSRTVEFLGTEAERLETDLQKKMDLLIDRSVHRDIHWMVFAPSWGLMLLRRAIERVNETQNRKVRTVAEIWPNLTLITTGARPLATYRAQLEEVIGKPGIDFQELYGASEGAYAYQNDLADPALLLHTATGVFYEFIPYEQYGRTDAERYSIAEVQVGRQYVLYVTNSGGLWAYDTGDIVEFTSLRPYKLKVKGRAIEILNSVGEFLTGIHIRQSLQSVCEQLGCEAIEVHASVKPATAERPHHHQWAIEWERPPASSLEFLIEFDRRLRQTSPPYASSRDVHRLGDPELFNMPSGTFQRTLQKQAAASVQTKIRLVSEDPQILQRLLNTAREIDPRIEAVAAPSPVPSDQQ